MSSPTKADLAGELDKRVRVVEEAMAGAKGSVKTLMWVMAAFGLPTIYGIYNLHGTMSEMRGDVKVLKNEGGHLGKSIDRLERKLDDFGKHRVADLGYRGGYHFHEIAGTIRRLANNRITLSTGPLVEDRKDDDDNGLEYTCRIADGVRVLVDDKVGKLDDLRVGMLASVVHHAGKAQLIKAFASDRPQKTPTLPPPSKPDETKPPAPK